MRRAPGLLVADGVLVEKIEDVLKVLGGVQLKWCHSLEDACQGVPVPRADRLGARLIRGKVQGGSKEGKTIIAP